MAQDNELLRRLKAAASYGDTSLSRLEKEVSFSRSTLYRRAAGDSPMERGKLYEISEATGAPMWFLLYGWEGWRKELTPEGLEELADELFPDGPPDV